MSFNLPINPSNIISFNTFLQDIQKHLLISKKDPLCLETSKYHYNLPTDVKIYGLEEASSKYKEFYERFNILQSI